MDKNKIEIAKRTIDRLSTKSRSWLHEVAQDLNGDADGYRDDKEARRECSAAGAIKDFGNGYIQIPPYVNHLVYSENYLSGTMPDSN